MQTVVRMKFGSHLYGTNTPNSDTDYKSVHIPDAKDILLGTVKEEVSVGAREKVKGERNLPTDVDDKSYSLKKFLKLAAEGQTVAIDMLFAPEEMILETSPTWQLLQENKMKLLTRKSASFISYCRDQADKYGIKGSRVTAAQAASQLFKALSLVNPKRRLGEVQKWIVGKLVQDHPEFIKVIQHPADPTGKLGQFLEVCGRKVPFTSSIDVAQMVYTKVFEEYGDRALKAQSNEGIDWKALSHAVRVGWEAIELLRTNHVVLPLRNADHVRAIKFGEIPYEVVANEIEELLVKVEDAAVRSRLPESVDYDFIEQTILNTHTQEIINAYTKGVV